MGDLYLRLHVSEEYGQRSRSFPLSGIVTGKRFSDCAEADSENGCHSMSHGRPVQKTTQYYRLTFATSREPGNSTLLERLINSFNSRLL